MHIYREENTQIKCLVCVNWRQKEGTVKNLNYRFILRFFLTLENTSYIYI